MHKVFVQTPEFDFVEIAQCVSETDADWVLSRYESGMVTNNGAIVTTKNLKSSENTPTLFSLEGT